MSVFIRKFEPGGLIDSNTDVDTKKLNSLEALFGIKDHKISAEAFAKDLENNFDRFKAAYEGTWTEKEKRDVIDAHKLFLLNVRAGNITGIDSNGRFTVLDPGYSGMDFDLAGGWGKYSYYVKRVADSERIVSPKKETAPKKKFTNTSILQDIYNKFFGGTQNADFKSFFDLDEVVEQDGQKVRGVKNRVNALLDLLNENYMSQYDDADEAFGGIKGATERVDRLRAALASGKLDNEDFAAAAALGLNLRALLSTDGNIEFDENGNFKASSTDTDSSSSSSTTKTAEEQLKEILYGPRTSTQEVVDTINGWDANLSQTINLGIDPNYRTGDYIKERILQSGDKNLDQYYKNTFFPAFFENLKTYTPEYINSHPNETKEVWNNKNQSLKEYVGLNLLIAIRNKLYGNSSLLSKDVDDNLNNIVGTNLWTVPGSFDEKTGTVALFDVVTGDYKRVSIKNNNLKIIPKGAKNNETVSLLQDYALTKLGVPSSKKGGKLQLGGTINNLSGVSVSDEEKRKAFEQMFLATPEPTAPKTAAETVNDKTSSTNESLDTHANEALYKDGLWNLETEDYARAASLIADLISLAGGAVGLGAGLTSTVSDIVGDSADESLTKFDVAKNALINVGWTAAGFIPGARLGKIGKALLKWGPRAVMVLDSMGLIKNEMQRSVIKKIATTGEITSEDFNILTQMGRAATGLTMGAKAMKREHIYNKGKAEVSEIDVKVSKGDVDSKVSLTPGEVESLNKTGRKSGQTKANELLQDILRNKGVDPDEAKKFTLRDVDFGEPGTISPFRETRYRRTGVAEEARRYTEAGEAHRRYLEENYGKYLKLENNGEGYLSHIPEVTNPLNRTRSWLYGDSKYNKFIQEFNESNARAATEAPATESRANENQVVTNEGSSNRSSSNGSSSNGSSSNENSVNGNSVNRGNQVVASEAPASGTPANGTPVVPNTSKDRRADINKRATELLNTIKDLSKKERNELKRIKKLVERGELKEKKYITLSETLDNIKNRTSNVANGTNNNTNRIGSSRNGSRLQKIINLKKEGGILFAQSGIKVGGHYSWYDNIFSKYSDRILNNLKQHKDEYAKWLNGMQGYHAAMKQNAGTNWNNVAYRDKSVKDYLDLYTKGYGDDNNYYNLNGIKSGLDTEGHYDIFGNTKRNNLERGGFKSDGLFSQMTDDRRLLGRRDDWNSEKLNEWKAKLNELGYDMALGEDNYYRIVTLDKNSPNNGTDSETTAGATDPESTGGVSVDSGDSGSGSNGAQIDGGDEGEGSNVRKTDYYQYIPAALALGRMIGDNEATRRRTNEYLRRLQVPLQLTYRFGRLVHGDYATKAMYENQAAAVRQQMSRPLTSNALLAALKQLEGERLASDLIAKGNLADNEMIRKTGELAAQEEKENLINATKTANANRALMAEDARYRAGVIAAADTAIHNNFDNWLMNYVEKPIQEEAYKRKAYQDYYNYLSMGPMEYDASSDPVIIDYQRQLAAIPADDPERATKRTQILEAVQNHIRTRSEEYKLNQLAKFRKLYPYIYQPFPFDLNIQTSEKPDLAMDFDKKGGILKRLRDVPKNAKGGLISEGYPAAVIRAKSKDNDRLIKLILEVIRNHKDLAKGVRITDYSKYIVK